MEITQHSSRGAQRLRGAGGCGSRAAAPERADGTTAPTASNSSDLCARAFPIEHPEVLVFMNRRARFPEVVRQANSFKQRRRTPDVESK
jgi:hypothetical protein